MATIRVPEVVPSPAEDARRLKEAFRGWGTDKKAIILVLGQRNASQRRKIRETYWQLYNEDLIDALRSELSGDFLKAVILWTYDPTERDARLAKDALNAHKKGTKHLQVIVEIACASSPHHLTAVRQAYCSLFDCSLEEDIVNTVPLPLQKILVSLVKAYRFDKDMINSDVASYEAGLLHVAIEEKRLDDHILFILGTRNVYQLRATFESYKQKYGNPIDKDVETCRSGDLGSLLNIAISCLGCPEKHFAEVINKSIVGLGTDEDSLTRAIVMRAEIDMEAVKDKYSKMYKSGVKDAVTGDTSGDYRNFLMALLGEKIGTPCWCPSILLLAPVLF